MPRIASLVVALAVAACGATQPPTPTPGGTSPAGIAPSGTATVPLTGDGAPGSEAPTATPQLQPTPPPAWRDAAIEQPDGVTAWASQPPGYYCDPCHNLAEDNLFGAAAVTGGFIAVGAVTPPAHAIALFSPDGASWNPLSRLAADDGSAAVAVAAGTSGIVLVGHGPTGAMAWAGSLHGTWTKAPDQASLRVAHAAGGMTSIITFDGGFVAAGYRDDPSKLEASGAVWRSDDGLTWTLDQDKGVFADGRILGLVAVGESLIAVGTSGEQIRGPAAAWRWTAATGWRPAEVPPGGGAMRAVAATPTGLVAVGVNPYDTGAAAWTSTDGSTWQAVPDQPAFHFFELPVRFQALQFVGGTLVAGGWRSDPGKGSSVVATSRDGRTWSAEPWQASFSGGQIDALAAFGGTLVAAGRVGYPDTNTAAVWVRAWP